MCIRYTLAKRDKDILAAHPLKLVGAWEPHYNLAPTLKGLVITADEPDQIQHMRFGLVPYWAKDLKLQYDTWNVRSEDALTSKIARPLLVNHKTCLIIADGFFEWFDSKTEKLPYYFSIKDRRQFCFAGLWSEWKDPQSGEKYRSFGIFTTEANKTIAEIHADKPRMPVILPRNLEKTWLNKSIAPTSLLALCVPYPDALMDRKSVSKRVNSVHRINKPNNDEGLIKAITIE